VAAIIRNNHKGTKYTKRESIYPNFPAFKKPELKKSGFWAVEELFGTKL